MGRSLPYSRRTLLATAIIVMIAVAVLTGCSKPASSGGSGASGTNTGVITVTKADADKTIAVSPGQTLLVVLDANPSTGYTWTVSSAPEFLRSEGEPAFESEGASGAVGAGGKQTLKFSVTAAGTGPLNLSYMRPWETGVAPVETFKVEVESK